MDESRLNKNILFWVTCLILFVFGIYNVFMVVPNERIMGAIQRIFYFHVASATACYLCFGVVLICGGLYLKTKNKTFDALSVSAGEVGFLFCTIVLVSGMIWGHTAWNTWFRFEPRLITFLLIWLIFLSFVLLRQFADSQKVASQSAVIGIMGTLMIPIMIYSIKLLPAAAQLHPQVIENRGLRHPSFTTTLMWMTIATTMFAAGLGWLRYQIELLRRNTKND
jgi:heme exporter protein C